MSEQPQHNESLPPEPAGQDVLTLIRKMQQQLVLLEKKIDTLINQSFSRPSGEKHFPKPFRTFGRSYRQPDRAHASGFGEKSFNRGRHSDKRRSEEIRGFDHKKKAYDSPREGDFSQERNIRKRRDSEKSGFDQKNKPFPYRRKDRS